MRLAFLLAFSLAFATRAADVTMGWDTVRTPVGTYRLVWGTVPGVYTGELRTTNTVATVTNLGAGSYVFAVASVTPEGEQSDLSAEVGLQLGFRLFVEAAPALSGPWATIHEFPVTGTNGTEFFRTRLVIR
jgi:hypothetical protein